MQISANVTIRRGCAYEIKATNADGTQLLRPTATRTNVDEVLGEMFAQARSQLNARAPAPVKKKLEAKPQQHAPAKKQEPATITYARRQEVSISTRVGSQLGYGLRAHASVKHGWKTKREIKSLAVGYSGWRRAVRNGNDAGWTGKHASWKDSRDAQYRRRDKRHESDPNPVHLDI